MAATLAGFVAVQIVMTDFIRQHLAAPAHAIVALGTANIDGISQGVNNSMTVHATPSFSQVGAWVLSSQIIGKTGQAFQGAFTQACLGSTSRTAPPPSANST